MPKYERFEDTPAWQAAAEMYNLVLDLLEAHGGEFTSGYRGQLDRCSLSVSNNIAEGFERMTTGGLMAFLDIARGSAGETESMMRVILHRPNLAKARPLMILIRDLADSLVRQLTGWMGSIEHGEVQGKRHLTKPQAQERRQQEAAQNLRTRFYQSLKPGHALYDTPNARKARGEPPEDG
ncbi:MAG: four helix bundle protein [Verrucomicrobia bacterium]|jgi:four helix bundle protein|nr:four helix bundle protein [Verrucomicrobiota bacterium]